MAFTQSYDFSQKCHYICFLLSPRFLFCNWYHIFGKKIPQIKPH